MSAQSDLAPTHSRPQMIGVQEGKLILQRCEVCGCVPSYPRIACPACFGELSWIEAKGIGTIQSYSILRRTHADRYKEHLPIVLVRIQLEEGGEMISTLIGTNRLEVTIGARAVFAGEKGWSTLPQFCLT